MLFIAVTQLYTNYHSRLRREVIKIKKNINYYKKRSVSKWTR